MRRLWAPWRIEYIRHGVKSETCFICDYVKHKEDDENNLVLFRTRSSIVLLNAYPYTNGHLMVAPVRHVGCLTLMSDDELTDMMRATRLAVKVLKRALRPDGFNVGINIGRSAGAGLADHLHVHIVPRWYGDNNFMSVIAETRLINQALRETYCELRDALQSEIEQEQ